MFEQIASQTRTLKTTQPIRPFKPASLKLACIGNCVVNKLAYLFALEKDVDAVFCSNLRNWGNHHPESFFERADEADVVLALYTRDASIFHDPEELKEKYGEKCLFIPLVWIEGLETLQMFAIRGGVKFFGGAPIAEAVQRDGVSAAINGLVRGDIRTNPAKRLADSLVRLRETEAHTAPIRISDVIEETYRERRVMHAVGHPDGTIVRELFVRVVETLGLTVNRSKLETPLSLSRITLPEAPRIFSPYDIDDLGLTFDYDPEWMLQTKSLITIIASQIKNGTYRTGGEGVA